MRSTRLLAAICIALFAIVCSTALAAVPSHRARVLMIVGGAHHDYTKLPTVLSDRLTARGEVDVRLTSNPASLTPEALKDYDVLLFNTCENAGMQAPSREAISGFVKSGKGLVVMHCSIWSYQDWPEWLEMVGGFAPGHGKYGPYPCVVLDPSHATMIGVGARFEITDEPYIVDKRDPKVNVLVRTAAVIQVEGQKRAGPEPQVWTKRYGKGRVFVTTFGHEDKSQSDERFISLLHHGVRWAAGRLKDTAHNSLTKPEEGTGWELLFNGRNLDGWTGDTRHWSVEDGELVGRSTPETKLEHNAFLSHRKKFGDFLLRFDVRLRNHNTGVQIRSRQFPENVVKGYQADVAEGWYGSLYEEGGTRGVLANGWKDKGEKVAIIDGWNEMSVKAVGPSITITLNGTTTVEYEEKDASIQPASGILALQLHAGPPMEVRFRDIRIQPLTPTGEPASSK